MSEFAAPVTVVVLDDDAGNRMLVERILARRANTEVLAESEGRRGIELVRSRRPGLVLLDLNLGDLGGEEILRELRRIPETAEIPVVVISGDVAAATKERLRVAGARSYVEKPISVAGLIELVEEILG